MIRVHAIPHSTNVERVELALTVKGLDYGVVMHEAGDRSAIRALSGQDLVPVVELDGEMLVDSMPIVQRIEALRPEPPLYPTEPAARREVQAFIDWFNFVWKVAPNAIDQHPDDPRVPAWGEQLRAYQHGFEALLHGRDYLFGDALGAADICAYPFLKFTAGIDAGDDDLFHGVLHGHLPGHFPRLLAWIDRVAARKPS